MSLPFDDPSLARLPFHEQSHHLEVMRPAIQKSLQRCWPRMHLDQDAHISSSQLSQIMEANSELLSVVQSVVEDISELADESHTAIIIVERAGYLIYLQGCVHITDYLRDRAIDLGTDLSEYGSGTNAFGLALIEMVPIEVEGGEHFLQKFMGLYDAAAPIYDPAGQLLGAVGVLGMLENIRPQGLALAIMAARAITEGVKVQEATREAALQKKRFEQILATNQVGVLVLDRDSMIETANRAGERLLGTEKNLLIGRSLHEVIQLPAELRVEIDAGNEVHGMEATLRLKHREVNLVISSIPFAEGQGFVLYLWLQEEVRKLAAREFSSQGDFGLKDIQGASAQMRGVRRLVKSAAQAKASILIVGEQGTGKSLAARVIHSLSDQREGPLIVFNCAALPHEMILAELQGNLPQPGKQGKSHASKFELANGGMLYFQDIDLLPLEGQEILLNYLKTGTIQQPGSNHRREVQVRILAATCVSLSNLVREGKFNADLLRWLSVFQIELPPLRERREDIPVLANHILTRFSCRYRSKLALADESLHVLYNYDWPGNIRELELIMERAIYCLGDDCMIQPAHLPVTLVKLPAAAQGDFASERAQPLTELQKEALIQAAQECNGNLSEIARVLGIGRTTVWRWFKRMNISPESFRTSEPDD